MNEIIRLQGVDVEYQVRSGVTRSVLKDTNLVIFENDWITISGPSGSGKTTLLKVIANYFPGLPVTYSQPEILDRLTYVTQEPNLHRHLTIKENLEDVAVSQEMVDRVLESLNLKKIEASYFDEISGGEKIRANLARATVYRERGILLLDEPTANLDLKHIEEMKNILTMLWREGYTLIVVSHSEEIFEMGKRRFLLSMGALTSSEGKE